MPKHPNRVPQYRKRPDAMKIEVASELGITHDIYNVENSVNLASGGEPKNSKKTKNIKNSINREYRFKNRLEDEQ
jgi:hypothetical protein